MGSFNVSGEMIVTRKLGGEREVVKARELNVASKSNHLRHELEEESDNVSEQNLGTLKKNGRRSDRWG